METWTRLVPVSCLLFPPGQLARSLGLLYLRLQGLYRCFLYLQGFVNQLY